jgi:hypothetical protein
MGTSALFTFRILKILKSHAFMCPKIIALKYIVDIYMMSACKKVPLKIHYILGNTKKTNFTPPIYIFLYI